MQADTTPPLVRDVLSAGIAVFTELMQWSQLGFRLFSTDGTHGSVTGPLQP